ncbi:hypothetical protein QEH56_20265 [Pelagicoccus enzymogenes]|uniref:hypothetical protein n=1 Tax=Pelagicoccus enzymogenes TaxID=2773457 RepID=UPI00280E26F6|nr:hypothetical protein [Pelagicoccus enzymogenes]MDQ8200512.1 hypothetical protein [Pelagicoccus enzymogenes]
MKPFKTYSRIDGNKFMIVFMMLVGLPFLWALLPILILSAPMKLIWRKERNRKMWRITSTIGLTISIAIGFWLAFSMDKEVDGVLHYGFPLVYREIQSDSFFDFGNDDVLIGLVRGFDVSIVTATLMLPFTIASYLETKRRQNQSHTTPASAPR